MVYVFGVLKTETGKYDRMALYNHSYIGAYSREQAKQRGSVLVLQIVYKDDNVGCKKANYIDKIIKRLNNKKIKLSELEKFFSDADEFTPEPNFLESVSL